MWDFFKNLNIRKAKPSQKWTEQDLAAIRINHRQSWDGVSLESTLKFGWSETRKRFASAGKGRDWPALIKLLREGGNPNDGQLDAEHWNTALHWAAQEGAPADVVSSLLAAGAWRTMPNADGKRPIDLALRSGHYNLQPFLEPRLVHDFPTGDLLDIQEHFHDHISKSELIRLNNIRLPELSILLELEEPKMSFAVPGMYGGYQYWLDMEHSIPALIFEATCRIVGGPVPRFKVTKSGLERIPSQRVQ